MGGHTKAQSSGFRVRMAFLQRFGKGQAAFRRMPPETFCMAGEHTGAQSSSFRVRMAFLQRFGKGQANSRRNASRGQPNGCPLLCGLSAAYRGAKNTVSRQLRDTAF